MELPLCGVTVGGRIVPGSFIARDQPNARKRSLRSFGSDESNYNVEVMEKRVRRTRTFEPNARKQSLRSFRRGESNYNEEAMEGPLGSYRTLVQQGAEDMLVIKEEFKALEQQIRCMMLSNQKFKAKRALESLNQWVLPARQNLDIAGCAEAAALSTTLPRLLGEGAVADEPITVKEHTAPEGPVAG